MRLFKALQDKLMDVRLRDKWIEDGKITRDEVEKYLQNLKDDSSELTYTNNVDKEKKEANTAVQSSE